MKDFINVTQGKTISYDEGLRIYMNNIYKYMSIALLITGLTSFFVANVPALTHLFLGSPLAILFMLAPLGFVFYFNAKIGSMSVEKARNTLFVFSGVMGISLSSIFLAYSGADITRAFFITSATFGGMSLYGYTTKKDLTGMGQFLMMGLIGVIIASIVNIFLKSSGLDFAVSILSVLIFSGLTAFDVQKLKGMYYQLGGSSDITAKFAIMGALNLYMDFINLFLAILRIIGNNRD